MSHLLEQDKSFGLYEMQCKEPTNDGISFWLLPAPIPIRISNVDDKLRAYDEDEIAMWLV